MLTKRRKEISGQTVRADNNKKTQDTTKTIIKHIKHINSDREPLKEFSHEDELSDKEKIRINKEQLVKEQHKGKNFLTAI